MTSRHYQTRCTCEKKVEHCVDLPDPFITNESTKEVEHYVDLSEPFITDESTKEEKEKYHKWKNISRGYTLTAMTGLFSK